ncbi:MAG: hypothetical protein WKG07_49060 [Hymenobacter sp.]
MPTRTAMPRDRYYDRYRRAPSLAQMVITGRVRRRDSLRFRPLPGALVSVVLPGGSQRCPHGRERGFLSDPGPREPWLLCPIACLLGGRGLRPGFPDHQGEEGRAGDRFFHLHLLHLHLRTLSGPIEPACVYPHRSQENWFTANALAFWPPRRCSTLKVLA